MLKKVLANIFEVLDQRKENIEKLNKSNLDLAATLQKDITEGYPVSNGIGFSDFFIKNNDTLSLKDYLLTSEEDKTKRTKTSRTYNQKYILQNEKEFPLTPTLKEIINTPISGIKRFGENDPKVHFFERGNFLAFWYFIFYDINKDRIFVKNDIFHHLRRDNYQYLTRPAYANKNLEYMIFIGDYGGHLLLKDDTCLYISRAENYIKEADQAVNHLAQKNRLLSPRQIINP